MHRELSPEIPKELSGWATATNDPAFRAAVIELAFDYRGDVTLTLLDGRVVSGYLFNRGVSAAKGFVELLCPALEEPVHIDLHRIAAVAFSGRDAAEGRSWEAWQKRLAEAEAHGELLELYPESLD